MPEKPTLERFDFSESVSGFADMVSMPTTGRYALVEDVEAYLAAQVAEAVAQARKDERERYMGGQLELRFGHGGVSCGVVRKTDGAVGIRFNVIKPAEVGQNLLLHDSPRDKTKPSVFLRFDNAKSATVLLECVSVLMGRLCGLPEDNIAAVEAAQQQAEGIQAAIDAATAHDKVCEQNPLVARVATLEGLLAEARDKQAGGPGISGLAFRQRIDKALNLQSADGEQP